MGREAQARMNDVMGCAKACYASGLGLGVLVLLAEVQQVTRTGRD